MATLIPAMLIGPAAPASAQSPAPSSTTTGTLHGQVTDPSGAVVPSATVAVLVSGGEPHSATTNRSGAYEIGNLAPGKYTVTANAKGFAVFVQNDVDVPAGQVAQFNIALDINVEKEKVNVQEEGPQLDVNPANNASAVVLSGKDLEALPDDPDELQSDLEALAGPSAGPNGGQLYIDGFTGGQLPPKSSIREIRVNQNPFSAEYDKLGYGRIEVFTKPGTDKYHGQFSVEGNSSAMNSRNPFLGAAAQQPYDSVIYMGNIGGPINKKASFFLNVQRRNINEIAVVNAPVLGLSESVPNPRTRTNIGPRLDYQISPNNTLTARYQFYRDTQQNAGVGGIVLPEAGYNTTSTEHTVQISDTQILGAKAINETRFQYLRENSGQTPLSTAIGINVLGSFMRGGSSSGMQTDHQDHYELQNYTSISQGKHFVKFGGRLRAIHELSVSSAGFNGTYTFPSFPNFTNGMPSQYSVNATPSGAPANVPVTMVDVGLYVQDDWKVRPNLTLSGGLRFETQNAIHDHADWAPRLGFAWGIGGGGKSAPKTVLRGGFGLFYDRFAQDLILNADRLNGVTEQQYVVSSNPPYPTPPPVNTLPPTTQAIYQINSRLHAPYIMQTAFSLERQVTKIANVTVSYLNARGEHQFLSLNVNAPPPGTPFSSGPPPNPAMGPIYQYVSDGIFRQNQLIANFNIRAGARLSLFGNYTLNYANSNASGASSFPSNQYDLSVDYGRASFDVRHRVFVGGTIGLPLGFRLSPFAIFNSGSPYNVTVGQDLSRDSLFNDRPGFAPNVSGACLSPTSPCHYVIPTQSYIPTPIPINYLTGPNHFTLNLRLAKTFGFGPEVGGKSEAQASEGPGGGGPLGGGGGPRGGGGFGRGGGGGGFGGGGAASTRRYSLTFSVNARNVLNKVNAATPIGVLSSPNFGQSIALAGGPFSSAAANRKIEVQAMFSF
ncbi:MAG TPA: carboxypeptidase regulatory-like domain-containing protein [Terriglobales bacterium]|nr:carboxypeptidase regulatory-like domain-containing protein [Terriglobales bacterium]